MLRMEWEQGVDRVIFTPHFYRDRESAEQFLERRRQAMERLDAALEKLPEEERRRLPELALGAEVAWRPNLAEWSDLERLCLGNGPYFLLELPTWQWNDQMIGQLYDLQGHTGLIPVIAHLERYIKGQKTGHIEDVLSLGVPVQLSAGAFLRMFERGKMLRLLQEHKAHLVASDAHNLEQRQPNLGPAMAVIRKKLGDEAAQAIAGNSDRLLRTAREGATRR